MKNYWDEVVNYFILETCQLVDKQFFIIGPYSYLHWHYQFSHRMYFHVLYFKVAFHFLPQIFRGVILYFRRRMDWDSYYNRLEGWVKKQYDGVTSVQRRLENSLLEQQKYLNANALALKKYKQEMGLFQSLYSRNGDPSSSSPQSDGRRSVPCKHNFLVSLLTCSSTIPNTASLPPNRCWMYWHYNNDGIEISCIVFHQERLKCNVRLCTNNLVDIFSQLVKNMGSDILSGVPEYRTLRRAHGWAKTDFSGKEFQVSSIWRSLFFAHIGAREDLLDFETIILADQIGRFLSALLEVKCLALF